MVELIGLLKKKKELLKEMLLLTNKQTEVIKSEEFMNIEEILDDKDKIIDKINEIDLKTKDLKLDSNMEDKEILNILSDIKNILNQIKTLDDENNKTLSKAMNDMQGEIKGAREGMKAMKNYGNSDPYQAFTSQGNSLFIDQDS